MKTQSAMGRQVRKVIMDLEAKWPGAMVTTEQVAPICQAKKMGWTRQQIRNVVYYWNQTKKAKAVRLGALPVTAGKLRAAEKAIKRTTKAAAPLPPRVSPKALTKMLNGASRAGARAAGAEVNGEMAPAANSVSFEVESKAKFVALIHYIGLGTANWLLQEEAKAILGRLQTWT